MENVCCNIVRGRGVQLTLYFIIRGIYLGNVVGKFPFWACVNRFCLRLQQWPRSLCHFLHYSHPTLAYSTYQSPGDDAGDSGQSNTESQQWPRSLCHFLHYSHPTLACSTYQSPGDDAGDGGHDSTKGPQRPWVQHCYGRSLGKRFGLSLGEEVCARIIHQGQEEVRAVRGRIHSFSDDWPSHLCLSTLEVS